MKFPPEVERWRPLVAKYFPPELVDKALWVIMYESGGNPAAVGDGGNAIGLFQIHHAGSIPGRPQAQVLFNPENNIRYAAQHLGAASGNWSAWGENNLYNGKPFGALGFHPYPGDGTPVQGSASPGSFGRIAGSVFNRLRELGRQELDQKTKPAIAPAFGKSIAPPRTPPGQEPPRLPEDNSPPKDPLTRLIAVENMIKELEQTRKKTFGSQRDEIDQMLRELYAERDQLKKQISSTTGAKPDDKSKTKAGSSQSEGLPALQQPTTSGTSWFKPYNPRNKQEYEDLLWEFQQAFAPHLGLFRKYRPDLTWSQLASTLIGAGGTPSMLPAGFQYMAEPPINEDTGKPMKGYEGPGIYLVTGSGNVKKVMGEAEARQYFDLADQFQTAVFTFDDYFGKGGAEDFETQLALFGYSPESLAWQDAIDRQSYEKALADAATELAREEAVRWHNAKQIGEENARTRRDLIHNYGHPGLSPMILSPAVLPSMNDLVKQWRDRLAEMVPPPPPRPVPNLPGLTKSSSPPRVPGWDERYDTDPMARFGGGPLPSVPM